MRFQGLLAPIDVLSKAEVCPDPVPEKNLLMMVKGGASFASREPTLTQHCPNVLSLLGYCNRLILWIIIIIIQSLNGLIL